MTPGRSDTASATTGLFANASRAENIAKARALLGADPPAADPQQQPDVTPDAPRVAPCPCPRCGARMIVIEVFARGCEPRWVADPERVRHLMSHTSCARRLPVRLRSPHAGHDLPLSTRFTAINAPGARSYPSRAG